jgi:hypothetical protein
MEQRSTITSTGRRSTAGLLSIVLLVGACGDGRGRPGLIDTRAPTELQVPSHGAYGILVVGAFRAGIQNVTLRIGSEQLSLSSYQGSLHFDTAKMSLLDFVLPEDDFHLVNGVDSESGTVRFAGFAVDGFLTAVEVSLSFETPAPIRSEDIQFELDVLGTSVGSKIRKEDVFEVREIVPEDAG